jgi:predicted TIM-barrel fold metal-dependent hydrolase
VQFIIPHLGSFSDDWRAQIAFLDPLARHKNIFTDTSGVRRFDLLEEAMRRAGAHKILFGTDGPWLHPAIELEKIRALKPSPTERDLMLRGNFLRLIGKNKSRQPMRSTAINASRILTSVPITSGDDPWHSLDLPE